MRRVVFAQSVLASVCCGLLLSGCLGRSNTAVADQVDVAMEVKYWPPGYVPYPPAGSAFVLHVFVTFREGGTQLSSFDLADGETFGCNGSSFEIDGSKEYTYLGALHDAPTLTCVYTRDGATTRFVITEPPRLRVLAPASNSMVPPGQTHVLVRFAPPTGPQTSLGAEFEDMGKGGGAPGSGNVAPYATAALGSASVVVPLPVQSVVGDKLLLEPVMTTQLPVGPSGFHSLRVTFRDRAYVPLQVA